MLSTKTITLRIQTPNGMKKLSSDLNEKCIDLYAKIQSELVMKSDDWSLSVDKSLSQFIPKSNQPLNMFDFKDGHILYIHSQSKEPPTPSNLHKIVEEDEVDQIIEKKSSLVNRAKSEQCNHNSNSKCINCSPHQIFDQTYLNSLTPPLKHISLHVYIRRLLDAAKNKRTPLFDEIRCKIKPGCMNHPPWPDGICTQCQPSSIALARQEFRNVDNIMLDSHGLVDSFIGYWRKSKLQRIGYLYGTYEDMENIPLGIRAHVFAIYEPPQISTFDSISLQPDPRQEGIDEVANLLGYQKIGWIISDLLISSSENGQMMQTRDVSTYLVSAQECITAAHFQNNYPNKCKYSSSGYYGSKFVTLIVTSNADGEIDFYGWQVSNQCMALVRDNCLVPTVDEPSLAYVRDQTSQQFIPDVFYKDVDEFKNNVNLPARPVPVEYFLIEVPTGFPVNGNTAEDAQKRPTVHNFNRDSTRELARESISLTHIQDLLKKFNPLLVLSHFNVLCFIYPLLLDSFKPIFYELCKLIKLNNDTELKNISTRKEFKELIAFISTFIDEDAKKFDDSSSSTHNISNTPRGTQASNRSFSRGRDFDDIEEIISSPDSSHISESGNQFEEWQCTTCTFINTTAHYDNDGGIICEMCSLPKR